MTGGRRTSVSGFLLSLVSFIITIITYSGVKIMLASNLSGAAFGSHPQGSGYQQDGAPHISGRKCLRENWPCSEGCCHFHLSIVPITVSMCASIENYCSFLDLISNEHCNGFSHKLTHCTLLPDLTGVIRDYS